MYYYETVGFNDPVLLTFSVEFNSWTILTSLGIYDCAFSVYHLHPVFIGGKEGSYKFDFATSKVWSYNLDKNHLDLSLPPMPTPRSEPSALSAGRPECLVVAGGKFNNALSDAVEILCHNQWFIVDPLPYPVTISSSTLHEGELYFNSSEDEIFHCALKSVMDIVLKRADRASCQWRTIKNTGIQSGCTSFLVSFGQRLLHVGSSSYVYVPTTKSWEQIDEHIDEKVYCSIVLSTGDLIKIMSIGPHSCICIYRAKLKGVYTMIIIILARPV